MLLLERVPVAERADIIGALREGRSPGLAASKQRMNELGIAEAVMQAIDDELAVALTGLEPHATLPPVPLMRQLADMLKSQVAALRPAAASR
jgi:hypothetical protein